jgi:hypothetical protein
MGSNDAATGGEGVPDSLRLPARLRDRGRPLTAAATSYTPAEWRGGQVFGAQPWQSEAWGFRRSLGEFNQAVDWMSRAMSRVRLGAAEVVPGADEPEMLVEGPAADLMEDFCGGPPGHSAFLKAITPHLLVPGEGWLIAERDDPRIPLSAADWGIYSTECVQSLGNRFRVRVGPALWRDLAPENLPMRIYEPDPQWPWLATSSSEAAVPIMRRIFLIDSRIISMMVSRLVMNGLLLIPQEGTFSVPPQFKDAPDPFVAMLMDIGSRNIKNPGQASAGFPIPVKFTADLIDKWKILKADDPLDEWLLKERLDELGRLGDTLGLTRERVTGGMGEQNHWGAAQANEDEIKITFAPMAETICGAITKVFLKPALRQSGLAPVGPRGGAVIAWYDVSELAARPDKSGPALTLYDRFELSGEALRRENGFDESDAPDDAELRVMILKKAATTVELGPVALAQLTGDDSVAGAVAPPAASGESAVPATAPPAPAPTPATGPPPTRNAPIPPPGDPAPAMAASSNGRHHVGTLRRP